MKTVQISEIKIIDIEGFLKKQIDRYEQLLKTSQRPDRIEVILKTLREELVKIKAEKNGFVRLKISEELITNGGKKP